MTEREKSGVFPMGTPNDAYAQYFDGQSYLSVLSSEGVKICNVSFEPGCRNHWHVHSAEAGGGQILLCTSGRGWYQAWGQPPRALHPGDVVVIPAGEKHWHGAAKDSNILTDFHNFLYLYKSPQTRMVAAFLKIATS